KILPYRLGLTIDLVHRAREMGMLRDIAIDMLTYVGTVEVMVGGGVAIRTKNYSIHLPPGHSCHLANPEKIELESKACRWVSSRRRQPHSRWRWVRGSVPVGCSCSPRSPWGECYVFSETLCSLGARS